MGSATQAHAPLPSPRRSRAVFRHDVLALLGLGLVLGLACRGHFAVPYADFTEFVDSGHAMWQGELPQTLKRAPVYSLLVVTLGHLLPVDAPDRVAAEWFNALLLPLNGLLIYLVGRRWCGAGARWAAVWFLLLPIGVFCTAHLIVEPLLMGLILLTILGAQRGSLWAYVAAAVATMTRFDAAGLIVGLCVADLLQRRSVARTLLRTALAAAPLVIWLALTALTWRERSADHYLLQIAEQPCFDLAWAVDIVVRMSLGLHGLQMVGPFSSLAPLVQYAVLAGATGLAVIGFVVQLRAREPATVTAAIMLASYVIVHTVFPWQFDRFGYPPAPLLILGAGVGLRVVVRWFRLSGARRSVLKPLLWFGGFLSVMVLVAKAEALSFAFGGHERFAGRAALLGLVALVVVWVGSLMRRGRRLGHLVLLLGSLSLLTVQVQRGAALLGTGQELRNLIEAARWIRLHTPPEDCVLSATPGLFRLQVGRKPPDRFVGYQAIEAERWPDIVAECRRRGIGTIVWHDALRQVHGSYYGEKLRLGRFEPLARAESAEGVLVERHFPGQPHVTIVRVLPATGD